MDEKIIETKKKVNAVLKDVEKRAKGKYCLICKKECSSFCNSHTVPQFVLRNIACNGELSTSANFIIEKDTPIMETKKGINNSNIFRRICNSCDKKYFAIYEDESILLKKPNDEILNSIVLKNILLELDKKLREKELKNIFEEKGETPPYATQYNYIDTKETREELQKVLNNKNKYNLFYWEKLDYIVPFAFQGKVVLHGDLEGNLVNDVYSSNYKIVMKNLYIFVFPLSSVSVVGMFINSNSVNYNSFIKQFVKLSKERKLQIINFLIFNKTESYLINQSVVENVCNNEIFMDICRDQGLLYKTLFDLFKSETILKKERVELLKKYLNSNLIDEMPNLLSEEYALK